MGGSPCPRPGDYLGSCLDGTSRPSKITQVIISHVLWEVSCTPTHYQVEFCYEVIQTQTLKKKRHICYEYVSALAVSLSFGHTFLYARLISSAVAFLSSPRSSYRSFPPAPALLVENFWYLTISQSHILVIK